MTKPTKDQNLRELIGRRLKAARWAFEENAAAFARRPEIDIDPQTLNKYEQGRRFPDEAYIVRFCRLTGCTADWLYLGRITPEMPAELAARIAVFDPALVVGAASARVAAARAKQGAL